MRNHRTLEASVDDAVHMVGAGLATVEEEAAKAWGMLSRTLKAHLTGTTATTPAPRTSASHGPTGSRRNSSRASESTKREEHAPLNPKAHATDPFVFYQKEGCWLWKREAASGEVVRTCRHEFRQYLDCITDAHKHGWKGAPAFLAQARPASSPFRGAISQQYPSPRAMADGHACVTSADIAQPSGEDTISQFRGGVELMLYAAIGGFVICVSAVSLAG